jgi:hybrid polyketide synthase/nonribosomal peptide synthetase ACE1
MSSTWPETLAHRLNEVIAKDPSKTAITETAGKTWTYQQLDAEVNRISAALLYVNITSGSVVAVFQEASALSVFSLIAIMRLGAIYVPLDCKIPPGRLSVILDECKPSALLTAGNTFQGIRKLDLPQTVPVLDVSNLPNRKLPTRAVTTRASDPAAILFTSGTTGIPKGVVLSHSGFINHVEALTKTHGFGSETVLQQSSVGFDMSLNQIFMALAHGGNLVIVPEDLRKDALAVAKIVLDHKITYTSATPSEYISWLRHGSSILFESKSWKFATAGGEQFSSDLFQAFQQLKSGFQHPFHAFNAYGPTEGSMSASEIEVDLEALSAKHISAGRVLPNLTTYIVDGDLNPLPAGFTGEICIAGAGVAIEYLNNPSASREKFVKDPQPSLLATKNGWDRMYRTGDKGALKPDGTLVVLGRMAGDTQIKLRGLRIEMHDIEQSIMDAAKGQVKEVIVTARGTPKFLIAHAIMSPAASVSNEADYLRELAATLPLPQYMRPAAIIPVPTLPLNASGKINRRALENMPIPTTSQSTSTRGLSETESTLAEVWEQVLPQQTQALYTVDETTDFFHVGGNSMLLLELRELVRKTFHVRIPLLKLFEHSTLSAMAAVIKDLPADKDDINWEVETGVPSDYSQITIQPVASRSSPRVIVLTGSTGFLGSYILRLLVENPTVEKIHCIAIRDSGKLAEFNASGKVAIHNGDLSLPRCGLSETEATSIFSSAEAIIHNGADVSFLKSYRSLKSPNLSSTKNLVRLALPRGIPFHFVSTATVGKFNKSDSLAPESLASFVPSPSVADGYAASKWASEVFLEKVQDQFGLPVSIHRPSSITGAQAGENDIVSNVLKYAPIVKALPESSRWTGYIDLISVENAAGRIVGSVLQTKPAGTGVEFLHHAGERVIPAQSINEYLHDDQMAQWKSIPMHEWVEQAVTSGMNPLVGTFLRSADSGQGMQIGQKLLLRGV